MFPCLVSLCIEWHAGIYAEILSQHRPLGLWWWRAGMDGSYHNSLPKIKTKKTETSSKSPFETRAPESLILLIYVKGLIIIQEALVTSYPNSNE